MHNIIELPAWERLFKKIVWKQIGNLEGKKILDKEDNTGDLVPFEKLMTLETVVLLGRKKVVM